MRGALLVCVYSGWIRISTLPSGVNMPGPAQYSNAGSGAGLGHLL